MRIRRDDFDDVNILRCSDEEKLEKEIEKLAQTNIIVDCQYSAVEHGILYHCALLFLKRKY